MTPLPAHPAMTSTAWADSLRRWPVNLPLTCAAVGVDGRWAVLGAPTQVIAHEWADAADPIAALDEALLDRSASSVPDGPHPGPGWVAMLSYELGAAAEPRGFPVDRRPTFPAWVLLRLDAGLAIDRHTGEAYAFGGWVDPVGEADTGGFEVGPCEPTTPAEAYQRAVARARAYTHAGDIFQANLAHRLSASFAGSPRALAAHLFAALDPAFPCYIELPGHDCSVISVSPELFLHCTHDAHKGVRRIVTRPIKGTRPGAHIDGLRRSKKDAAELAMIVDLMRNDLGRVAAPGTVKVQEARTLEVHHGGHIAHTSATVRAILRENASIGDVLRATMPPGSVTGAPKVRALQIIEELERPLFGMPRGAYCGGMGYLGDSGDFTLNVGIRTLTVHQGRIDLPVGAGIVADSNPEAEWEETLAKARPIVQAMGATLPA